MSILSERLSASRRKRVVKNPIPWYSPRFWHGMRFSTWLATLARNDFRVSFSKLHTGASITFFSGCNSLAAILDNLIYGRRVSETEIKDPPIFILGHWRAGTTFLHELLIRDPAHTFPTTYQCFVPHHFVLTDKWLTPWTEKLLPSRRPMDNMAAGWQRPQEDEFALGIMGLPSPYLSMMFPQRGPVFSEYLDLQDVPLDEKKHWQQQLLKFFQRITFRDPRRIVVKSPPHTARVRALLELFPDAKFVHIVRNPCDLFMSTVNLWKSLNEVQRMQGLGEQEWVEEYVLDSLQRMYTAYENDRELLEDNQVVELRYEDLVENPLDRLRQVYEHLDLGAFTRVEKAAQAYLAEVKNYRRNHYELSAEKRQVIQDRWKDYFERYGYEG
ncbi:MAG: sulfotransferase family protein [Planctomycetaceae bacterium]|nr:sulfotransferase family protein [Planctomycetaceae bacterium]